MLRCAMTRCRVLISFQKSVVNLDVDLITELELEYEYVPTWMGLRTSHRIFQLNPNNATGTPMGDVTRQGRQIVKAKVNYPLGAEL